MGKEYLRSTISFATRFYPDTLAYASDGGDAADWTSSGTGSDWNFGLDTTRYLPPLIRPFSTTSLRMRTKATSPAIGDMVNGRRNVARRESSIIELSLFLYVDTPTGDAPDFDLSININRATTTEFVAVRHAQATNSWEYKDSSGSWQTMSNLNIDMPEDAWQFVRLRGNASLGEYIDFTVGGITEDLSGIAAANSSVNQTLISIEFTLTTSDATQNQVNIADIQVRG